MKEKRVLSLVERIALVASITAEKQAQQNLVVAREQTRQVMFELELDPDKRYNLQPNGEVTEV